MRILLAVDGSAPADRALDLVAALPWGDGGRVRIVTVAPDRAEVLGIPWSITATADAMEVEETALRAHRDALEAAERELRSVRGDLAIEPVLLRGRVATAIVDEARRMPADLIVVGHRGHGDWQSALLGSVSAEVVDRARCPVLVARDDRIGPVILADDGSPYARAAESILTSCPLFAGLPITVVSVVEDHFPTEVAVAPVMYAESIEAHADALATERASAAAVCTDAAGRLRAAGLDARPEVRMGDPAHEIIEAARQQDAGVIVVGTRGQTGLRRMFLGSVARKVLLHAPCSVLVTHGGVPERPPTRERHREPEVVSPFG